MRVLPSPFAEPRFSQLAKDLAAEYRTASPFPHVVIDNFLSPETCAEILKHFPQPQAIPWTRFDRPQDKKLASNETRNFAPELRTLLMEFNGPEMIGFLEALTGIEGFIGDPWLEGGGLHQIQPGGFLKIHADFNRHRKLRLDRRINLLLYLNEDWKEEYGGHLELWDPQMQAAQKRILPILNRCVIFSTTSDSFHGHPEPLTCPPGWTRKSLALYYYTSSRPEAERRPQHSTLYRSTRTDLPWRRLLRVRLAHASNKAAHGFSKLASLIERKLAGTLRRLADFMEFS